MNKIIDPCVDWSKKYTTELSSATITELLSGQIPYIRIRNFASPEECEALVQSAVKEGFSSYRGVEPTINRIGNTVFEYNSISKHEYFKKNISSNKIQQKIFSTSFNPLERFIMLMRERTGKKVSVAKNDAGAPYYSGLVRRIENGTLLHVDFAPGEQPDWDIASIQEQLVWNLYLRVSHPSSGRTHVYNRQWQPSDDTLKEGIYGFNRRVIQNAEKATFEPSVGDVIIFNTRNFHYVDPAEGERVAFTSGIGRTQSDEMVLWS